jgi:hypothetical protein
METTSSLGRSTSKKPKTIKQTNFISTITNIDIGNLIHEFNPNRSLRDLYLPLSADEVLW